MSDYAIGDIQGCYEPLMRLLEHIRFNDREDRLWFVGDLVNRGPDSLKVLRVIKQLPLKPVITLGNHDLHLIHAIFAPELSKANTDDTLSEVLSAFDREELGHWLRQHPFLYHDESLNILMCHAGICPLWDIETAKACALELGQQLSGSDFKLFLATMYGNYPNGWQDHLKGADRARAITNYFTRMRFCNEKGELQLSYKGTLQNAPSDLYPWFAVPGRKFIAPDIVFGHWAALQGQCPLPNIYAIDTGCLWGGRLTALRLQDRALFSVTGHRVLL